MISEERNYKVLTAKQAKSIVDFYLFNIEGITLGLPEINDKYHIWKVSVLFNGNVVGEVAVDAYTALIQEKYSSPKSMILSRIQKAGKKSMKKKPFKYAISPLPNTIVQGRAENALQDIPDGSVDLIFTSPPYFNARKEYSEYETYEDYLSLMRKVITEGCRVLADGRFFVINTSHVLLPRASRNESSVRIAVPFDLHRIFMESGFEFIDDIIWEKPEGAGWASGRGRRFSADRNPLQYKTVPVTEYVMVYRKKSSILIDEFIRKHPCPELVKASKIADGYERTNIWRISPARDKRHPAVFPQKLAENVIRYYSFVNDVVLDPFAGIGTTAKACAELNRRFYMIESNITFSKYMVSDLLQYKDLSFKIV